jgi:hypothetical protein
MDDTIAVRFLFTLLLLTAVLIQPAAREIPLPEEEAPASLFSTQLGDSDVQLFLEGRWRSELTAGFGYTYDGRTGELYPSTLPELSEGIAFSQQPNLTLSLWLRERYFFETVITEEQELETFLFGYNGDPGDPVEKVRLGNSDLGMGDFGYLSLPAASRDSFGAYGLFNGSSSTHHLAARFDPAGRAHKAYLGRNQIEEERLSAESYVRGRFFVLPDANVSNLRVFMEDPDGSFTGGSTTFKELGAEEMSVSAEDGLVYLREPADGRVAVYYTVNGGTEIGDGTLGIASLPGSNPGPNGQNTTLLETQDDYLDLSRSPENFNWSKNYLGIDFDVHRQVTLDGNDCLLLHVPGKWSPFELQSVYRPQSRPDDPEQLELQLVQREARSGERVDFLLFQEELVRLPAGSSLRDPVARYPLYTYGLNERAYYGPEAPGLDGDPERELLFQQLSPVSGFLQEEEALPGSIQVLRDGRQVSAYSFDPATGEVSFFYPVGQNERIDIFYRSPEAASAGSGDLLLASANRFSFSDELAGSLDFGLRWNAGGQSYTVEQSEAEGSLLTSGGLEYESESFGASLQGAVGVHNPNTTGYRRLLGMGEGGVPVPLLSDGLYPAPPLPNPPFSESALNFTKGNRGALLFRDYYSSSFAGGQLLQKYSWDPPSDQTYAYGERVGPYLAATGSETPGNTAVFQYDLGSGEWVGGLIPLVKGEKPLDLSNKKALTFQAKHLGFNPKDLSPIGNVNVHIVFGLLPEDIDSDDKLDQESSRYDDGFSFDHTYGGTPYTMPVAPVIPWAPDRSSKDTEDLNGNGVLNDNEQENIVVKNYTNADFSSGWKRFHIQLAPDEREKLTAVTSVAVYLEETSSPAAGRLLLANPSFTGSSFSASSEGPEITTGTKLLDSGTSSYEQLLSYDDAVRFNGPAPISIPVNRVEWGGAAGLWHTTGYFDAADLEDYRKLSFFMRIEPDAPGQITLSLTNPSNEGVGVQFTPNDNAWHHYTWDLDTGEVTADGTDQGASDIGSPGFTVNRSAANVSRFTIEADTSAAGALEIDEVHLHEPRTAVNAGGRGSLRWEHKEPVLTAGETPLLHSLKLESSVHAETGPLAAGFTPGGASRAGSENVLSFGVLDTSADLNLNGDLYEGRLYATGGYALQLPLFDQFFNIEDSYQEGLTGELERTVSRSSSVGLQCPAAQASGGFRLHWDGDSLSRNWRAEGSVSPEGPFSADAALRLGAVNEDTPHFSLEDLPARFGSSYALYLTDHTAGSEPRRTTEATAALEVNGEAFTFSLSDTLSSRTETAEEYRLAGSNSLNADLFLSVGEENRGQYSLGYSRTVSHAEEHEGRLDYLGDAGANLQRLAGQGYAWIGLPLLELWHASTRSSFTSDSAGFDEGRYKAELSTGYSRSPGSTLSHLFLPGHLHFSALRSLQREQETVRDTLELDGSVRTTALNLFGSLGRYPAFTWYRTEEISHTFGYNAVLPLYTAESEEEEHSFSVQQFIQLQIAKENSITWDGRWELTLPADRQELSLSAEWRHSPGRVSFPAFVELLKEAGKPQLVHTEKLDLYFFNDVENQERELQPLARHTTEFLLDEVGSIGLTAALGYMRRETGAEGGALHTFGGELGITADFTF